jgi:N-[(2S)-2-amino-2-carboxyethyl]-L-glutamate dehydrogenase
MSNTTQISPFYVVPGSVINDLVSELQPKLTAIVAQAYLAHQAGHTVNPDSYFLRFPKDEKNRIIALPAAITDAEHSPAVTGIKWIASYPGNIESGIPRASAVLILNDRLTGYPYALLEAAKISALRTAASATLAAFWLNGKETRANTVSFIGAGVIARNILDILYAEQWVFNKIYVHDTDSSSSRAFISHGATRNGMPIKEATIETALSSDIVIFATNSGTPYVSGTDRFRSGQIILNISLRDIAPEIIHSSYNYFDDVEHCLKANTSPHLALQKYGNTDFVTGTLGQIIRGDISICEDKPKIFSPFGLGILDLALGNAIYELASERNLTLQIPGFFAEEKRW